MEIIPAKVRSVDCRNGRLGNRTVVKCTNGTMPLIKSPTSELTDIVFDIRSQFSCRQNK
jgi:hypothetical protein